MASSLAEIKAKRKEKSYVIQDTSEDKQAAIDKLFNSMTTAPPQAPVKVPVKPPSGVELYSTMGVGSILINGESVLLPYIISDPIQLMNLRAQYSIDSPTSFLRTRKVK